MTTKSNTSGKSLTNKQTQVLQMILGGANVTDAAQVSGVSRKTIYSWRQQEHFAKALADEKELALERLSQSLASLSDRAVSALSELLDDPNSNVRLRAADLVITRQLELKDTLEFERRIKVLEDHLTNNRKEK